MEEQNQNIALLTDSLSAQQALSGPTDIHTKQLQDHPGAKHKRGTSVDF